MSGPAQQRTLEFGLFEVNPVTSELFKAGRKVDLERQPFVLLMALLQRPGALVTRDELRAALWPDGSFVDFNAGLNVAVKKLRDALGDSSENPRFIETLPRRGYRFIAPVDSGQECSIGAKAQPVTHHSPAWMRTWAAVALGVAAGAVLYWRGSGSRPEGPTFELKPMPLTSYPGIERSPALSPDGKQVAFSWDGENQENRDIYVKLFDTSNPVRLTTNRAADDMPVWSPDGRSIAFVRSPSLSSERAAIWMIPALGGPERELVELAPGECYAYGTLSWSPDGEWLAFADKAKRSDPFKLYLVSVETGEKKAVTSVDEKVYGDAAPVFSPDGRSLAFVRLRSYGIGDIYVTPIAGGNPRRVTDDNAGVFGLSWTADGKELVFSSDRSGGIRLWRIPSSGGTPKPLPGITGSDTIGGVSIRGQRLAFAREIIDENIWKVEVQGPKMIGSPKKLIASTRIDANPQPSPDGTRIAFGSNRSGSWEIWVSDRNGQNPIRVTAIGRGNSGWPTWSPDGRLLAFDSDISGNWGIYVVNSNGGRPRALTPGNAADAAPSWSRDGKWIYFHSNREGTMQIWKIPSQGGAPAQVTRHGGLRPAVSQDGKLVYYARGDEIWRVPAEGGEETRVLSGVAGAEWAHWVPADGGLHFRTREDTPATLSFLDFKSGRVTPVMRTENPWDVGATAISPDARYLLFNQIDQNGGDLMWVENFR